MLFEQQRQENDFFFQVQGQYEVVDPLNHMVKVILDKRIKYM